ncbi:hypothetical protein C8J57DRAFT_1387927 [Mycena rebaudengoi]|nr:hypothetical protein C8J57DRAFT_1387927 [Mycena rebaudengoi]
MYWYAFIRPERTDEVLKRANEALKAMEAHEEQGSIVQVAATRSGAIETGESQISSCTLSRFASGCMAARSVQVGVLRAEDAANARSKIVERDSAVARLEEHEDSGPKLAECASAPRVSRYLEFTIQLVMHVVKGHFDFIGDLLIEQGPRRLYDPMRPSIEYLQVSAWSVRAATDHRPDLELHCPRRRRSLNNLAVISPTSQASCAGCQ